MPPAPVCEPWPTGLMPAVSGGLSNAAKVPPCRGRKLIVMWFPVETNVREVTMTSKPG
jgi:hypothetical protein